MDGRNDVNSYRSLPSSLKLLLPLSRPMNCLASNIKLAANVRCFFLFSFVVVVVVMMKLAIQQSVAVFPLFPPSSTISDHLPALLSLTWLPLLPPAK